MRTCLSNENFQVILLITIFVEGRSANVDTHKWCLYQTYSMSHGLKRSRVISGSVVLVCRHFDKVSTSMDSIFLVFSVVSTPVMTLPWYFVHHLTAV